MSLLELEIILLLLQKQTPTATVTSQGATAEGGEEGTVSTLQQAVSEDVTCYTAGKLL